MWRFKISLIAVACAFVLSACVRSSSLTLPDGRQGVQISCNGIQHSIGDCYAKAGELCPGGYNVLLVNGEATPFLVSSGGFSANTMAAQGGYSTIAGSSRHRTMIVECR